MGQTFSSQSDSQSETRQTSYGKMAIETIQHKMDTGVDSGRVLRSRSATVDTTIKSQKRKATEKIAEPARKRSVTASGITPTTVTNNKPIPLWAPVGKVDVAPVHRRSGRGGEKDFTVHEPRIRRRKQKPRTADPSETTTASSTSQVQRPMGLHSFKDWITKDLEKAMVNYFHARLKYEGAWEELELHKTVKEDEPEEPESNLPLVKVSETQRNRKSGRISHTPSNVAPGIAGKRIGFAPYTLRDSRCLHALHCTRNATEPIQISEGRHGQDARFEVEEMPEFLHDLAEEIRAEFPGELDPPSLDYAQINVINVIDVPVKGDDEAISLDSPKSEDDDKCKIQTVHGRRNVVLDFHKDHLTLGDIAVLCLQGSCTLRMRHGTIEYSQLLRPRTLYLLRGPAREVWEHAVDDVHGERISVIFRSRRA